jgi:hypothetical protein
MQATLLSAWACAGGWYSGHSAEFRGKVYNRCMVKLHFFAGGLPLPSQPLPYQLQQRSQHGGEPGLMQGPCTLGPSSRRSGSIELVSSLLAFDSCYVAAALDGRFLPASFGMLCPGEAQATSCVCMLRLFTLPGVPPGELSIPHLSAWLLQLRAASVTALGLEVAPAPSKLPTMRCDKGRTSPSLHSHWHWGSQCPRLHALRCDLVVG